MSQRRIDTQQHAQEDVNVYLRNSQKRALLVKLTKHIQYHEISKVVSQKLRIPNENLVIFFKGQRLASNQKMLLNDKCIIHIVNLQKVHKEYINIQIKRIEGQKISHKFKVASKDNIRQFINNQMYQVFGQNSEVVFLVYTGKQLDVSKTFEEEYVEDESELLCVRLDQSQFQVTNSSLSNYQENKQISPPMFKNHSQNQSQFRQKSNPEIQLKPRADVQSFLKEPIPPNHFDNNPKQQNEKSINQRSKLQNVKREDDIVAASKPTQHQNIPFFDNKTLMSGMDIQSLSIPATQQSNGNTLAFYPQQYNITNFQCQQNYNLKAAHENHAETFQDQCFKEDKNLNEQVTNFNGQIQNQLNDESNNQYQEDKSLKAGLGLNHEQNENLYQDTSVVKNKYQEINENRQFQLKSSHQGNMAQNNRNQFLENEISSAIHNEQDEQQQGSQRRKIYFFFQKKRQNPPIKVIQLQDYHQEQKKVVLNDIIQNLQIQGYTQKQFEANPIQQINQHEPQFKLNQLNCPQTLIFNQDYSLSNQEQKMMAKHESQQSERHTQIQHDYENKLNNQEEQQSYRLQQIPNSFNNYNISDQDNTQNINKHQIIIEQQKSNDLSDQTEPFKSENKVSGIIPKVIQQMSNPQVLSFKNAFNKLKNKKVNNNLEQKDQNEIKSQKISCDSINKVPIIESLNNHENHPNEHSLIRQKQEQVVSHNLVAQKTQLHSFNSSESLPSNDQLPREENLKREMQQKVRQQNNSTTQQPSISQSLKIQAQSKKQQQLKSFTNSIEENHKGQCNETNYQVNSHPIQTKIGQNEHIQYCMQDKSKGQRLEKDCRQNIQHYQVQDHQEASYQPQYSHQQDRQKIDKILTKSDVNKQKSQNEQCIEFINKESILLKAGSPENHQDHVQKRYIHEINTDVLHEQQDHANVDKIETLQENKEQDDEQFEKIEVPLQQNVQFKAGDLIYSGEMNIANTEHLMQNILEDYSHLLQKSQQN